MGLQGWQNGAAISEESSGGPELISLRELARRLVAEGIVEQISRQRVQKLATDDPDFPPTFLIGRVKAVDWRQAEPYFRKRKSQQGRRTDLERKRAEAAGE
jgi:hypothetical protein